MLRAGAIVLTILHAFNLFLAIFIAVMLMFFVEHPLISRIVFTDEELARLGPKVVATIRDLAIGMNSGTAALSFLILVVIWTSLVRCQQWAFWTLLVAITFTQTMQFVGDAFIGNRTLPVSIVFAILNAVGIGLAGFGLLAERRHTIEIQGGSC